MTITRRGLTAVVPAVCGWFCDACSEIEFDEGTDSLDRYVDAADALVMNALGAVVDLADLKAFAIDVFGSEEAAHVWLAQPHPVLGDSPIAAAVTLAGAQRVREILAVIKYGGVA